MGARAPVVVLLLLAGWPVSRGWAQDGARREEVPAEPAVEPVLTKPPVLIQAVAPEYPPAAAKAGLEADVLVRIDIDEHGIVTKVEVVSPVGNGFDEAAVAAAEQYVFEPAEWDGVPGPITVETTIHFEVEEVEEPDAPPPAPTETWPEAPPGHAGDPRLPVTIEGTALERGTRRKLAGVVVSVVELGWDAVTDERGRFYIHGVPPGSYTILAVADEFDRFRRPLTLGKDEKIEISLYLRPRGGNPYETVVESEAERLEVTKRTLQRRQMTTVPGTFGDPIRVVQSLPGLARAPFVLGFLLIRGSFPGDSGVYVDGHEVPLLFHFLGGPSFLNPEFLGELTLYPGGFPARFGRAHGGIVAVETRNPASEGIHGSADIDLLDAGAYLRVPVGKRGGLAVAGRRSYLNLLLPFFLPEPSEGSTLIVTPVYQDYNARFDYDLRRHGSLSLFLFGSSDRLDVLSTDTETEQQLALGTSISFFRFIATYRRRLIGELDYTMSAAFGRDTVGFSGGQTEDGPTNVGADIVQQAVSYRMRVWGKLTSRLRLDTGFDVASRVTTYELLVPIDDDIRVFGDVEIPSETLRRTIPGLGVATYAELAVDVGAGIRVIPGLRLDGYLLAASTRYSLDPRLVVRWQHNARWTSKGYVGWFHQEPQPEQLDQRFGNPDLELEHAIHTGIGGEWRPNKDWTFDVEAYYIDRNELAQFTNDAVLEGDGTVSPLNFVNSGDGYTHGLELMIRREVTKNQFGWLSYTLSRTMVRGEPDDPYIPSTFDQRHNLNLVYSYTTDGGWELGGRFRLSTGRPQTPIVGSTFEADDNDYEQVFGDRRTARAPLFHQLDVRAEKTWLFNTWSMGVYLDVQNVLNVENVEATQYDYRFRDSAPVTSVPIVPTLGVRGRF